MWPGQRIGGQNDRVSRPLRSHAGRVVLLNGPPSCGKTALANALLDALEEPWFHRSLDDFRAGYLDRFWHTDDGALFERLMHGYLAALRAMALAGNNVIAEAVITATRVPLYSSSFDGLPVILIGVRCPLEIAVRRERKRTDRLSGPLDLPPEAFAAVHAGIDYDLDVDTSIEGAEQLAARLAPRLRIITPRAFEQLRATNPSV